MIPSVRTPFVKNPIWSRVLAVSGIFFLIGLSDSMLAYWVPPFIEKTLGSAFLMGLVMSFSSLIGIIADFFFPQIIKGVRFRKLIRWAMVISVLFGALLVLSSFYSVLFVILIAMAAWGVYYELLSFSRQQFLANNVPKDVHAGASAVLFSFRSLAYTIGPLLAGVLLGHTMQTPIFFAMVMTILGGVYLHFVRVGKTANASVEMKNINVWAEMGHWKVLFRVVWPMIVLSVFIGIIDSVFWTVGVVFSEGLAAESILARLILPAYVLPGVFVGPLLSKMNIVSGKKRIAQIAFLFSGLALSLVGIATNIYLVLLLILLSSILSSISYPLVDAVYSDIVARMGRQRYHLIGMSSSAYSASYIIGPILAGTVASLVGGQKTFTVFGIGAVLLAVVLLLTTKKKLLLPQDEIRKWG